MGISPDTLYSVPSSRSDFEVDTQEQKFEGKEKTKQLAKEGFKTLSEIQSLSEGLDGQQPKDPYRTGSKENMNADGDPFLVKPLQNTYFGLQQLISEVISSD